MNENFDLDRLVYVPAIRSRQAELKGYANVRPGLKVALRPIVSLGRLGQVDEANRVAEKVSECMAGPFFLDLNMYTAQQCKEAQALVNPDDNFAAWRTFAENVAGAVPVALIRDGASERAFVRQVVAIEAKYGVVAIRSRRPGSDLELLRGAISAVEDVNNLLVILDFGYIRASLEAKEVEASRVISGLRTTDPTVRIVLLSSSFPRAISAYGDTSGRLEIQERELHARLGGDDVAIYGDHAAIYPDPFEASVSRWVPRIDYATPDAWTFRRYRADDGGFGRCAKEIVGLSDWDPEFAKVNWGAKIILQQSKSKEPLPGCGSPAAWIGVRVNTHIERQATYANGFDEDEGDHEGEE